MCPPRASEKPGKAFSKLFRILQDYYLIVAMLYSVSMQWHMALACNDIWVPIREVQALFGKAVKLTFEKVCSRRLYVGVGSRRPWHMHCIWRNYGMYWQALRGHGQGVGLAVVGLVGGGGHGPGRFA